MVIICYYMVIIWLLYGYYMVIICYYMVISYNIWLISCDTNSTENPLCSQEISTMQVVQGLSKAAEKGAAKAEMKSKEATSRETDASPWLDGHKYI